MAETEDDDADISLYNTTFTLHHVSPLYLANKSSLTSERVLRGYAVRLRDIIRDSLREVPTFGEVDGGRDHLVDCTWRRAVKPAGIHMSFKYERGAEHRAFLAAAAAGASEEDQNSSSSFAQYPLLFTRMPAALRETLLNYISHTFDARCSPVKFASHTLAGLLDEYATASSAVKGVHVGLAFPESTAPALKTMDVILPAEDVEQFVSTGGQRGLVDALGTYLYRHLGLRKECIALDAGKSGDRVKIVKVACAGFVLGEGKVKIFPSVDDAEFISDLISAVDSDAMR